MPPPRGSDALKENRRAQILEAALRVFARLGFHRARMDDIAREAGLSKGALYWYFEGKDALIAALLDRFYDWEMRDLGRALEEEGPVVERLRRFTERLADQAERLSPLLPIAYEFYAVAARQAWVREALRGYFDRYREGMAALLRAGVEQGELRPDLDPEAEAVVLLALYEGLFLLWTVDPEGVDWRTLARRGLETWLTGALRAPEAREAP